MARKRRSPRFGLFARKSVALSRRAPTRTRRLSALELLEPRQMLDGQGLDFPSLAQYETENFDTRAVAAADINGDGHADLITANWQGDNVSVLRNLGDGTYATQVSYAAGSSPRSVTIADIDGDGHNDIVTANENSDNVSVLRNFGDGTFATQVTYAAGNGPSSVTIADIDGDGQNDIVTANEYSDNVSVLRNSGDGTFATQVTYAAGDSPGSVTIGDIDGDGRGDIVTTNQYRDTVSILRNLGGGTFAARVSYAVGDGPRGVTIADFDGDGRSDIATANEQDRTTSVLTSLGNGAFAASKNYLTGSSPYAIVATDINADGHVDLITGGYLVGTIASAVSVHLNAGDGTFLSKVDFGTGQFLTSGIVATDVDSDGRVDLATVGDHEGTVSVLRNLGNDQLASWMPYRVGEDPRSIASSDLNGDGFVDLVTANYEYASVTVLRNLGDGIFAESKSYSVGDDPKSVTTADVDGDGYADLIVAGGGDGTFSQSRSLVSVLKNLGDGTFAAAVNYSVGYRLESVATADINGDGHVDIITAAVGQDSVRVLLNQGNGTFVQGVGGSVYNPQSVTTADIDGDGHIDLVVSSLGGTVAVLRNLGGGTLAPSVQYFVGSGPYSVTAADVDKDGHVDLVAANRGDGTLAVLRNEGDGTFAPRVTYAIGLRPVSVTAADVNDDGFLDLIAANRQDNTVSVLKNLGDGTFSAQAAYRVDTGPTSVVAADVDLDGQIDLLTVGNSNTVSVLRNLGQENSLADLVVSSVAVEPASISVGEKVTVEYAVQNVGQQAAVGNWLDSVYLSRDTSFDLSDILLGRVLHTGGLESGESRTHMVEVSVDFFGGFVPGEWHILVRTDVSYDLPEDDNSNNTGVSQPIAVMQEVTTLTLGESFVGDIGVGESRFFQVDYAQGDPLAFRLAGLPADGVVELFILNDGLPSRTVFDLERRSPFVTEQYIYLPKQAEAGTFFVLVHASALTSSPTTYELTSWVPEFGILSRSFGTAGNAGDYTLHAVGAEFDSTITARLTDGQGFEFAAKQISTESETDVYATFDMRGVAPGTYNVVFTNAAEVEVTVPQSLTVTTALDADAVVPRVIVPDRVRRGVGFTFTVVWENTSLNDVPAPLITVGASVPFGSSTADRDSLGTRHTFLGTSAQGGPAGILRPGQSESVTFYSYSDTEPGDYTVFVDRVVKDASAAFDWESRRSAITRPGLSGEENASLFDAVKALVGSTEGDYLRMLSRNATNLPEGSGNPRSETELLQIEIDLALATIKPHIAGRLIAGDDADLPASISVYQVESGESYTTEVLRDGSFLFPWVALGEYALSSSEGILTEQSQILVSATQSADNVSATFGSGSTLALQLAPPAGMVVDSDQSFVTLVAEDGRTAIATSTGNGGFEVRHIAAGTYTAWINTLGFARTKFEGIVIDNDRSTQNVPVPLQVQSVLSGTVQVDGQAPAGGVTIVARKIDGDIRETYFSQTDDGIFTIEGISSGDYEVWFSAEGVVGAAMTVEVGAEQTLTLGVVELSSIAAADAPGASSDDEADSTYDAITEAQLAAAEAFLFSVLIPGEYFYFGPAVANLWVAFLSSTPASPTPERNFFDGDSVVEGYGLIGGFREDVNVQSLLDEMLSLAATRVAEKFASGELTCADLNSSNEREFELDEIVPEESLRQVQDLIFNNPLSIPGNIAGGQGDWLGRLDKRQLGGKIYVRLEGGDQLVVESGITFTVIDGVDFEPGDLVDVGGWLQYVNYVNPERRIVVLLDFLEDHGRAYGVPYTASFTDEPGRTETRQISMQDCCDDSSCDPCNSDDPPDSCTKIKRPASWDPNDIIGPAGYGLDNHIVATSVMPYTIRFENDAEQATAPAAMVTITQTLDADLDWTTFRLGDVGFGDVIIDTPDDTAFFQTRYDATETLGVFVDIEAGIDVATGEIRWEFVAIDPATGDLPEDPFVGFLPPNASSPEGEGYVTYSVRPKATVQTGDRIDAVASIVFDVNEPILTPAIFHTFDVGPPTSAVGPLPAEVNDARFMVNWLGTDDLGGSGIATTDVYVSINDGPFTLWLNNTIASSAYYEGRNGDRYAFYSVATDNVGHVEATPPVADAETFVFAPPAVITASSIQNGLSQRSFVDTWSIDFDRSMDLDGLIASGSIVSAFTLTNLGVDVANDADQEVPLSASQFHYVLDSLTGVSRLTWSLDSFAGSNASLEDGLYQLHIDGALLPDSDGHALDGDFDDQPGGVYTMDFYRLAGDADGNSVVDALDMQLVNDALGARPTSESWNTNADLDRDGRISVRDRLIAARSAGNQLVPEAAQAIAAIFLPGDYNGDATVDSADYTVWRDNLGSLDASPFQGDGTGDGVVDQADYDLWRANYGSSFAAFLAAVPAELPGDYNGDGAVNAADYSVWRDELGATTPFGRLAGDGDGDLDVDTDDYAVWRSNFGRTAAVGPTQSISEPVALAASDANGDFEIDGNAETRSFTPIAEPHASAWFADAIDEVFGSEQHMAGESTDLAWVAQTLQSQRTEWASSTSSARTYRTVQRERFFNEIGGNGVAELLLYHRLSRGPAATDGEKWCVAEKADDLDANEIGSPSERSAELSLNVGRLLRNLLKRS